MVIGQTFLTTDFEEDKIAGFIMPLPEASLL